jgi:rsbT co-antagonist protein RsbR
MNSSAPFPADADPTYLRRRVAELEHVLQTQTDLLSKLQMSAASSRQREDRWRELIDLSPDAMIVTNVQGRITLLNRQTEVLFGYDRAELLDQPVEILMPASFHHKHVGWRDQYLAAPQTRPMGLGLNLAAVRKDGQEFSVEISLSPWTSEDGLMVICTIRDITKQKQAELERQSLQEEIIQMQEALLHELSTPLIPISNQVLVMPLVGSVDSRRAQQIVETLLEGINARRAASVILDITGVRVVDTQVANTLLRAAQAARLLGTQVILSGIRPEVAQTLVGLGVDLSTITTCSSLQHGIAYATVHT